MVEKLVPGDGERPGTTEMDTLLLSQAHTTSQAGAGSHDQYGKQKTGPMVYAIDLKQQYSDRYAG